MSVVGPRSGKSKPSMTPVGAKGNLAELHAYLTVHRPGADLPAIMEALWPDATLGRAAQRLSTEAVNLRRSIRSAAEDPTLMPVVNTGGRYHLDPSLLDMGGWQQGTHLVKAAATTSPADQATELRAVLNMPAGVLAEGCDYDWITTPRQHLPQRTIRAYLTLAALSDTDPSEAPAFTTRAADLDATNEDLAQRNMQALVHIAGIHHRLNQLPKSFSRRLSAGRTPRLTHTTKLAIRVHGLRDTAGKTWMTPFHVKLILIAIRYKVVDIRARARVDRYSTERNRRHRRGPVSSSHHRTATATAILALLALLTACTGSDVKTLSPEPTASVVTPTPTVDPRAQSAVAAYESFSDRAKNALRHPYGADDHPLPSEDFAKYAFDPFLAEYQSYVWGLEHDGVQFRGTPPTHNISVKSIAMQASPYPRVTLEDCETHGGNWRAYDTKSGTALPQSTPTMPPPYQSTITMILFQKHWGVEKIDVDASRTCEA